jgi:hypothetical protein
MSNNKGNTLNHNRETNNGHLKKDGGKREFGREKFCTS